MRSMLLALILTASSATAFAAQPSVTVNVTVNDSAQQAAERIARRGVLAHCARRFGRYEGCGFSSVSADHAIKSCCFWGRRPVREIGVARGPRGWYAVVWYE